MRIALAAVLLAALACDLDAPDTSGPPIARHCNDVAHARTGYFENEDYLRCLNGGAAPPTDGGVQD
jgi:hypothetical protein